jgi:hypothetical protein
LAIAQLDGMDLIKRLGDGRRVQPRDVGVDELVEPQSVIGFGADPFRSGGFRRPNDDRRLAQVEMLVDGFVEIVTGANVLRIPPGGKPGGLEIARELLRLLGGRLAVVADEYVRSFRPARHDQDPMTPIPGI